MATSNIYDLADTWDEGATTFTAIKMNVTDTASATGSLLMDLQLGGASKVAVRKDALMLFKNVTSGGAIGFPSAGNFQVYGSDGQSTADFSATNLAVRSGASFSWSSSAKSSSGAKDLFLTRDAANVLAQRNGANAQTARIYNTYTDASNYERLSLTGSAITVESAGTGTANIDLALVPAGTGLVKFGAHSSIGAETVTGYITIKDSGGTTRKLAVVS